jgi:hypothetical protein
MECVSLEIDNEITVIREFKSPRFMREAGNPTKARSN